MYCGAYFTVPGGAAQEDPNALELQPGFEFEKKEDALEPSPPARAPIPPDATREDLALRAAEVRASYGAPPLNLQPKIVHRPEWGKRYWLLMLTMIPLLISSLKKGETDKDIETKVEEQISELDESERAKLQSIALKVAAEEATAADFFDALPGHKLKGALLPAKTWAHWGMALFSAIVFLTVVCLLFPSNTTSPAALVAVGAFTGTIGILLLLGVQWIALHMSRPRGHGVIGLILLLLWLIGLSYTIAERPEYGFVASLLGFTFGVGLCEELCKALPIFHHFVSVGKKMDWRGACVWGLASGIGFGVSEGISYSTMSYNGILGADIYVIRFASCVALHAAWSASAAISIWKRRDDLNEAEMSYWMMFFKLVLFTFVPMLLHGAYDTLLKKDHEVLAVLVALASFAYLAWKIEDAKKVEKELEPNVVTA
jgi:RsiW-degrading membrane proteinase PrsW (M82 family)